MQAQPVALLQSDTYRPHLLPWVVTAIITRASAEAAAHLASPGGRRGGACAKCTERWPVPLGHWQKTAIIGALQALSA